jgi:isocitrate/isopropylmalate dehydrogenase
MTTYSIAAIPGDGIGVETFAVARHMLDELAPRAGFGIDWHEYDWGSERCLRTGTMMPEDGLAQLSISDAIVASNLFGDLLSDLAAALAGGILRCSNRSTGRPLTSSEPDGPTPSVSSGRRR